MIWISIAVTFWCVAVALTVWWVRRLIRNAKNELRIIEAILRIEAKRAHGDCVLRIEERQRDHCA